AGWRDPDQEGVRPRIASERLVERRDDRDVPPWQDRRDVATGLGRVDHRPDVVRPVADHADRRLAVVEAEVALGEDHEAALRGRGGRLVGHGAESTETAAWAVSCAGTLARPGARTSTSPSSGTP